MGRKRKTKYLYVGCFLSDEEMRRLLSHVGGERLPRPIEHPHVTFDFLPEDPAMDLFGTAVEFDVVGYGNDGMNEGVSVVDANVPNELEPVARRREGHHITLSLAPDARAVDTVGLEFSPIDPLRIAATYGGCTHGGEVVLSALGREDE